MMSPTTRIVLSAVVVCAVTVTVAFNRFCATVVPTDSVMSSHGWGTWFGETLMSFAHHGERVCIPEGWEPVGAITGTSRWVRFPEHQNAVMIRPEAFSSFNLAFTESAYHVRVLYPRNTPVEALTEYRATIVNAFERVGALYPHATDMREHTVFITVGLAGPGEDFETTVYPEPGPTVSTLARHYTHSRSEELFTHAIAHLYNRHRTDLAEYQQNQAPIPPEDFQELEASWFEIPARMSDAERRARVEKLYTVHEAVHKGTYVEELLYPFSEQELFESVAVRNIVVPPGSHYSDYQYGHYILAPLVMVAVDGLLHERGIEMSVENLMVRTHTESLNFMNELRGLLPQEDMEQIERWQRGEDIIPRTLVMSGLSWYSQP